MNDDPSMFRIYFLCLKGSRIRLSICKASTFEYEYNYLVNKTFFFPISQSSDCESFNLSQSFDPFPLIIPSHLHITKSHSPQALSSSTQISKGTFTNSNSQRKRLSRKRTKVSRFIQPTMSVCHGISFQIYNFDPRLAVKTLLAKAAQENKPKVT